MRYISCLVVIYFQYDNLSHMPEQQGSDTSLRRAIDALNRQQRTVRIRNMAAQQLSDMATIPATFVNGQIVRGARRVGETTTAISNPPEPVKQVRPGKVISSPRSYGIEFEINFAWSGASELRQAIGETYNIVHDGSVRNGLEIVSPVLYGGDGEKQIDTVCKEASTRGALTDETTGLHVHFGAKDFFTKSRTEVWPLSSAIKYAQEHPNSQNKYIILHDSAIKDMKQTGSLAYQYVLSNSPIPFFTWEKLYKDMAAWRSYSVIFANTSTSISPFYLYIDDKNLNKKKLARVNTINNEIPEYTGQPAYIGHYGAFLIDPKTSKNLHVIVAKHGKNDHVQTSRLKRLAAFYTVFDDVIASMLPGDRRENDYTRRTNHRMSIEEILDCSSTSQFLTSWLRFTREEQVEEARPDARPRGRYCGLNLYALLKQGTIEVRYLGGTLEPERVKHWIALHHAIIDLAASTEESRGSVQALEKASLIVDHARKTNLFFKKLRLKPATETYWRTEIEKHKDDDEETFRECVEMDIGTSNAMPNAGDTIQTFGSELLEDEEDTI